MSRAFECDTCPAWFSDDEDRYIHMAMNAHFTYTCKSPNCTYGNSSTVVMNRHLEAHHADTYCLICRLHFQSNILLETHIITNHHPCEQCGVVQESQRTLQLHIDAHHSLRFCEPCNRHFMNENNYQQHLKSRVHLGQTIKCIFCPEHFTTAAGVAHHLETGSCPRAPQVNRERLYEFIREKDPHRIITEKLLPSNRPQYEATEKAWNPDARAYECYLCHRLFMKLQGLTQHLRSPVHEQKLYHCPHPPCRKRFVSLAAMYNHWERESESCGYKRFRAVQRQFNDMLQPGRGLAYH